MGDLIESLTRLNTSLRDDPTLLPAKKMRALCDFLKAAPIEIRQAYFSIAYGTTNPDHASVYEVRDPTRTVSFLLGQAETATLLSVLDTDTEQKEDSILYGVVQMILWIRSPLGTRLHFRCPFPESDCFERALDRFHASVGHFYYALDIKRKVFRVTTETAQPSGISLVFNPCYDYIEYDKEEKARMYTRFIPHEYRLDFIDVPETFSKPFHGLPYAKYQKGTIDLEKARSRNFSLCPLGLSARANLLIHQIMSYLDLDPCIYMKPATLCGETPKFAQGVFSDSDAGYAVMTLRGLYYVYRFDHYREFFKAIGALLLYALIGKR